MNDRINRKTKYINLGLVEYETAWHYQTELFNQILEVKKNNRGLPKSKQSLTNNFLIFCEHPHVFTLGKNGEKKNLLISDEYLDAIGATYHHTNRGGDITYHGPGQIVVYPIIDMENFFTDIHKYMRLLEESVLQVVKEFGLNVGRVDGLTGVWVDPESEYKTRKICALGVKTSQWVTLHGLAFNVNTDLSFFQHIIPCGIEGKVVTSLEKELDAKQDIEQIKKILLAKIVSLSKMTLVT